MHAGVRLYFVFPQILLKIAVPRLAQITPQVLGPGRPRQEPRVSPAVLLAPFFGLDVAASPF